jgi:hypothetical protein
MMTSFMIDLPFRVEPFAVARGLPAMTGRRTDL